jgi:hypothetical protein
VTLALGRGFKPVQSNTLLDQLDGVEWKHNREYDVKVGGIRGRAVLYQLKKRTPLPGSWAIQYVKRT